MAEKSPEEMSPEELEQAQQQQCIFCHIAKGEVASKKIHEDDKCLAILDINPANPGHILLVPKEHYSIMPLIPADLQKHLALVTKQLSQAALKSLQVEGTTIFVANGAAAGQKAPHFMIHIIPRAERDGLAFSLPKKKLAPQQQALLAAELRKKIAADFGLKLEETAKPKEIPLQASKPEKRTQQPKEEVPAKIQFQEEDPEPSPESIGSGISLDDIAKFITGRK